MHCVVVVLLCCGVAVLLWCDALNYDVLCAFSWAAVLFVVCCCVLCYVLSCVVRLCYCYVMYYGC